jgi:Holliday junction resolvase RusA-like endonuclease
MRFILEGKIPSKKNTWRLNKWGKIYQSEQTAINALIMQLLSQKQQYVGLPVIVDCMADITLWGDNRNDLDNQITSILDIFQKAEIIKNDRLVKHIVAKKIVGKISRVEIDIKLSTIQKLDKGLK